MLFDEHIAIDLNVPMIENMINLANTDMIGSIGWYKRF